MEEKKKESDDEHLERSFYCSKPLKDDTDESLMRNHQTLRPHSSSHPLAYSHQLVELPN